MAGKSAQNPDQDLWKWCITKVVYVAYRICPLPDTMCSNHVENLMDCHNPIKYTSTIHLSGTAACLSSANERS